MTDSVVYLQVHLSLQREIDSIRKALVRAQAAAETERRARVKAESNAQSSGGVFDTYDDYSPKSRSPGGSPDTERLQNELSTMKQTLSQSQKELKQAKKQRAIAESETESLQEEVSRLQVIVKKGARGDGSSQSPASKEAKRAAEGIQAECDARVMEADAQLGAVQAAMDALQDLIAERGMQEAGRALLQQAQEKASTLESEIKQAQREARQAGRDVVHAREERDEAQKLLLGDVGMAEEFAAQKSRISELESELERKVGNARGGAVSRSPESSVSPSRDDGRVDELQNDLEDLQRELRAKNKELVRVKRQLDDVFEGAGCTFVCR